jgi:hypothetical protein
MAKNSTKPDVRVVSLTPPPLSAGTTLTPPLLAFFVAVATTVMAAATRSPGRIGLTVLIATLSVELFIAVGVMATVIGRGRRGYLRFIQDTQGVFLVASRAVRLSEVYVPALSTAVTIWIGWHLTILATFPDIRAFVAMLVISIISWVPALSHRTRILNLNTIRLQPEALVVLGPTETRVLWDDLATAVFERRRGIVLKTEGGPIVVKITDLRCDPALVADLIQYYKDHPEARPELTDHRVTQRIRFHQFNRPETAQ